MTNFSNPRRNPNDMTSDMALGPHKTMPPTKTMEGTYNEPGLPKPPAGYGRVLSLSEEAMEDAYPDLNDNDAGDGNMNGKSTTYTYGRAM